MSEVYINGDDSLAPPPIFPTGPSFVFGPGGTPHIKETPDRLYVREEFSSVKGAELRRTIEHDTPNLDVSSYQFWAQDSWKAAHGTYAATERFSNKLIEEHEEFLIAAYAYVRSKESIEHRQKEMISEAGDVLWCANGIVSNASGYIRIGIGRYLYEASMGTIVYDDTPRPRHPVWRTTALGIATNNLDSMTYGDLDKLLDAKFMSHPSSVMNIDDEDEYTSDPMSVVAHFEQTAMEARALEVIAKRQYNYGEDPAQTFGATYHTTETYLELTASIEKQAAKMILDVGFVLHALANVTLGDAVKSNYSKIQSRINAGRIDRSDGERSSDLL